MSIVHAISKRKILVTGASGFIGSHLCHHLLSLGAEVHKVSRTELSKDGRCSQCWHCDLSDIAMVRKLLNAIKPDMIFHLSSHVTGARELEFVLSTFQSNLLSTVNLLTVATEIGCQRIILTGSLEEPDESHNAHAVPCSPYAASKWASSAFARMFHQLYKTPVTIARLFMVYGPGQKDVKKLVPYVTLSLLRRQRPKLTKGQRLVDWIYVQDIVEGLLSIAQADNVDGRTVDLGSGDLVPIETVVKKLVGIIDPGIEPVFGAIPERPMEQIRVANVAHTYDRINWKPVTSLDKGLENTVDWYKTVIDNEESKT